MEPIPTAVLGRTGRNVTRVGLGGEGILRTHGRAREAGTVIREAERQGITYWDSARAYAGSEGYYGAFWAEYPGKRGSVFQTSKSARRDREGAIEDLNRTLALLRVPYLDLWQMHDLRTMEEVQSMERSGGALEAFLDAKEQGIVRWIGVTGHHDPGVLTYVVEEWPVDTVLLPVNPVEGVLGGFLDETLPAANRRNLGVIGMKVLGAGRSFVPDQGVTAEILLRYALSQPVDVVIVGCSTPAEVETLARTGREDRPVSIAEQKKLLETFSPYAERLAYYRGVI